MVENTNSNIDPRADYFTLMARGLNETGKGQEAIDNGRANLTCGMVMAYAAIQGINPDAADTMLRMAKGLHADPKQFRTLYADSFAYWRDHMRSVREDAKVKDVEQINIDRHMAPAKAKDDHVGSETREQLNRLVIARLGAIKAACSVLVAFVDADIEWAGEDKDGNAIEYVKLGARGVSLRVTVSNLRKLYGDKKKASIDALEMEPNEFVIIKGNMGKFRFSTLAERGDEAMKLEGIKKDAPKRDTGKLLATRDALKIVAGIGDEDAKAHDAKPDENGALQAFVGIANYLNDSSLKHVRLDNVMYSVVNWITEGMAAEAEGKPVPPQYKALHDFANNMLDKHVAKENGKPKQKAAA